MMAKGFFIAGTDTGIGKTCVTVVLMQEFKKQGYKVAGMKPIASGADKKNGSLRNEDAELIQQACSEPIDYELINPVVFELPVSPHIAAKQMQQTIDLTEVADCYQQLASNNDLVIVEGVGGWRVPISDEQSMADLAKKLDLPVILVVGFRLGCINHAILTAEAIKTDGLSLFGWISNRLEEDYLLAEESLETLKKTIKSPYLANLPFGQNSAAKLEVQDSNMLLDSNSL
ncbi:MAG: dethiobiotin synthase [Gammaproteobacteria bacterium]|jgi:dethiobiotin synthetase